MGDGTEYSILEDYVNNSNQNNLRLMKRLPKEDYDILVGACDVGLIFLDHRFTIPNFPSRLLAYMQVKLPVLAVTDPNTDIGNVVVDGGFGWWCESNDSDRFIRFVKEALFTDVAQKQINSMSYLEAHYSTKESYSVIMGNQNK